MFNKNTTKTLKYLVAELHRGETDTYGKSLLILENFGNFEF